MNWAFVLAAASVIICFLFFLYFRWYIARRISAHELLSDYRVEVNRLIAQIDTATDRDAQLVEDRIKTLKGILEDTDKRIAVYLRDTERSRQGQALYTNLGRAARSGGTLADAISSVSPPVPAGTAAPAAAAAVEERAQPAAKASPAKKSVPAEKPELKVQIAELAAKGNSPQRIASKLKISQSEVDLALSLLGRQD